ncbi:hypothetical protein [Kitasatospora sp. NPDC059571]|uniref:hypothetical protein n=1 Tax=Kitasatospora sp. NPDC059571 TaxID=3346871 RepID=UPI003688E327
MTATEETGRRVQQVLDRMAADGGDTAAAEELVRELMAFYGEGLARMVALLSAAGGTLPPALLDDDVVAGLLVLHDLHPESVERRITRALDGLPGRGAVLVAYRDGTATVRLEQSGGCGCGGTDPARAEIAAALACHAPEVAEVRIEEAAAAPVLLQIGRRPAVGAEVR